MLSLALGQQESVSIHWFSQANSLLQPTRELKFNSRSELWLSFFTVWTAFQQPVKEEAEKASLQSEGQHGGSKRKWEKTTTKKLAMTKEHRGWKGTAGGLEHHLAWHLVHAVSSPEEWDLMRKGRLKPSLTDMQNIDPRFTPGLRKTRFCWDHSCLEHLCEEVSPHLKMP